MFQNFHTLFLIGSDMFTMCIVIFEEKFAVKIFLKEGEGKGWQVA